jgi:hypothetical protein
VEWPDQYPCAPRRTGAWSTGALMRWASRPCRSELSPAARLGFTLISGRPGTRGERNQRSLRWQRSASQRGGPSHDKDPNRSEEPNLPAV